MYSYNFPYSILYKYLSENNRPFSDHSKLLELQNINGINTGITLQSTFSCTQIIAHISMKTKERIG